MCIYIYIYIYVNRYVIEHIYRLYNIVYFQAFLLIETKTLVTSFHVHEIRNLYDRSQLIIIIIMIIMIMIMIMIILLPLMIMMAMMIIIMQMIIIRILQ